MAAGIRWFLLRAVVLVALTNAQSVLADTNSYNDLLRSRDAILQRRQHLQDLYNQYADAIEQLQQNQDQINSSLKQINVQLNDLDNALAGVRQ